MDRGGAGRALPGGAPRAGHLVDLPLSSPRKRGPRAIRVTGEDEFDGLDITAHGERAYDMTS